MYKCVCTGSGDGGGYRKRDTRVLRTHFLFPKICKERQQGSVEQVPAYYVKVYTHEHIIINIDMNLGFDGYGDPGFYHFIGRFRYISQIYIILHIHMYICLCVCVSLCRCVYICMLFLLLNVIHFYWVHIFNLYVHIMWAERDERGAKTVYLVDPLS